MKYPGTQVSGKQGREVPAFLTHCTEAALDPSDRRREADRGTEHLRSAPEQYARSSKEQNR